MIGRARVVIADDHPIVLAGLRNLVQTDDGLELVGEATTGLHALNLIRDMMPDIAVIDFSMPELNGLGLARQLAAECPSVRAIALTVHEDRAYVRRSLDIGMRGYVLKRSAAGNLLHAIHAVLGGGTYLDPSIAGHLLPPGSGRANSTRSQMVNVSDREEEVLKLTAQGLTNKETAKRLDLAVRSVETYKSRAMLKLELKTRADLVRFASVQGWLDGVR